MMGMDRVSHLKLWWKKFYVSFSIKYGGPSRNFFYFLSVRIVWSFWNFFEMCEIFGILWNFSGIF